ncbi:MAG: hypothetical protein KBT03_00280 [Bacteroidales bacterium]|nr:hypothetical protein [Candidatus Scybalousia scybalohippi]
MSKQVKFFTSSNTLSSMEEDINNFLKDNEDKISDVKLTYQMVKPSTIAFYSVMMEYLLNEWY